MKIIAINGSSRKDGNTAIMLNIVLKELEKEGIETKLIQLANHAIQPCKACFTCGNKGNCSFQQDMFYETFEKIKEADGILLGSPVYSADVSSNMKAFIDRAAVVADMNPGILKHKVAAGIVACRRGGAVNAFDTLNHFFLNHEMFVVGSTYWNIGYGQIPGDVLKDEEAMENMKNLGQNIAFLLKMNKEEKKNG